MTTRVTEKVFGLQYMSSRLGSPEELTVGIPAMHIKWMYVVWLEIKLMGLFRILPCDTTDEGARHSRTVIINRPDFSYLFD